MDYSSIADVKGTTTAEEVAQPFERLTLKKDEFKIVSMNMRDAESGQILWAVKDFDISGNEEQSVHLPKRVLECKAIAREIVFFSENKIEKFSILQTMGVCGQEVEQLNFDFGFVIPQSTNSWDQIIVADSENMMPAEVLSGNLVVDTFFKSGDKVLAQTKYRVFYV